MDADRIAIAEACLQAAHADTSSFPAIVGRLVAAGFEGYAVDFRGNCQTYYLPGGDSVTLPTAAVPQPVAARFDAVEVARLVKWAQMNPPDYTYAAFCDKAKAAGCAGYQVSFLGRRVVYFGRTAETHVELFPQ